MNYSFTDYENAILNALSPLKKENGGYLRVLKGYAGELDAEEAFNEFYGLSPGVIVEIIGADYNAQGCIYKQDTAAYIYVLSKSLRSQDDARKGGTGVYKILCDIREKLLDRTLGLNIMPLKIIAEKKITSTNQLVLYYAHYEITNNRITGG